LQVSKPRANLQIEGVFYNCAAASRSSGKATLRCRKKRKTMRNKIRNRASLILVFGLFLTLFTACGGGKPAPLKYQGNWIGEDGTTIYMRSSGNAGFVMGSTRVRGGGAIFDESAKTLTISVFGIGHTWKIDQEPNEQGEMRLDGKIFRKR
jgi:hypothetical protein